MGEAAYLFNEDVLVECAGKVLLLWPYLFLSDFCFGPILFDFGSGLGG